MMAQSKGFWRKSLTLAFAGGAAFWLANFAISLAPIAAEYRAALSISYFPMLLEAIFGGLIIGFLVSYLLLRFYNRIPGKSAILKSVILSIAALIVLTLLVEVPAKFFPPVNNPVRYFAIGLLFNAIRIPALGLAIGYLYLKIHNG